jgi:RHS repeat-associated protein
LPFGEIRYQSNLYNVFNTLTRYTFSAKERDSESGYSYFGARYYDSDLSIWISVDPMSDKYPSLSPYNYCANNPIMLIDPNGKEPILPYAGTVGGFVKFINGLSSGIGTSTGAMAHAAMLRMGAINGMKPANTGPFNTTANRYIYTEKGGWIDMSHFIFYAGRAYGYKQQKQKAQKMTKSIAFGFMSPEHQGLLFKQAGMDPVGEAVQDGFMQEASDRFTAPQSAYSYEDLPSDKFGAEFGANYFDPNSKQTFGEQLKNYLNNVLKATDPINAPNYNSLPNEYPTDKPTIQNKTTKPLFTTE